MYGIELLAGELGLTLETLGRGGHLRGVVAVASGELDHEARGVMTAVIAMAKGLQIDVVAEGVETVEQLEFLRRHGCDMMQGFLFSRALPAAQLEPILRKVLETPRAELVRNFARW